MKNIWNAVAVLSLLHLLVLGGALSWLGLSGRLNQERLKRTMDMFALSVEAEKQQQAAASEEAALLQAEKDRTDRLMSVDIETTDPSLSEKVAMAREELARRRSDLNAVRRNIEQREKQLAMKVANFQEERRIFEQQKQDRQETLEDDGFQKTVRLYELMPARNVKDQFVNMLVVGNAAQREESLQKVALLLDAMEPRKAASVLKQFKADGAQEGPNEIALVVMVMERLRDMESNLVSSLETQG